MDVLDVSEACKYLKIAKVTLYSHLRAGRIPGFKVGRMWRFHKESLDNWIKNTTTESTQARKEKVAK